MKAVLFIILLSIGYAIHIDSEELEASSCLYRYQGLVWNIGDLIQENDYLIDDTKDSKTKVYFNVCKKVTNKGTQDSYATLYQGDKGRSLTNAQNSPKVYGLDDEHLRLYYEYSGSESGIYDSTKKQSFDLQIYGNKKDLPPQLIKDSNNPGKITVSWESTKGCPIIKANALWNFFHEYKAYLAPGLIIAGIFYLIFGGYFKRVSIFIITFFTTLFVVFIILYAFILSYKTPDWVGWIILILASVAGLLVAFFTSTFMRTGIILIGAWAGGMLGTGLFQTIFYLISSSTAVLWTLIIVGALIGVIIALKFFKYVMIVGTSFIGAYLTIRGFSMWIGGYPNEFDLNNQITAGDIVNVPYSLYLYVIGMIILAVLSIIFKTRKLSLHTRDDKSYVAIND